jgi:mRNA interferase MazF
VVLVLRDQAIASLQRVVVAPVSTTFRGIASEISLGTGEGLRKQSVAQCDTLQSADKKWFDEQPVGRLSSWKLRELDAALRYALGIRH